MFPIIAFCISASADEIPIGWIGPLTGNSAVLGVDSVKTISMVFGKVNSKGGIGGRKLRLVAEDDQYQTAKSLTAYRKLVAVDGARFIFVITYGGLFALADAAERDKVILVDPLDCDEKIAALNKYVLCVAKTTESLGTIAAERAVRDNHLPAAIAYLEGDPFPKVTAEHAKDRLVKLGAEPVIFEGYQSGASDFRALIGRMKKAGAKSLFMYGYDEMGLLARQAKELNFRAQIYTFGTVTSPGFLESAQGSADGAVVIVWRGEGGARLDSFLKKFEATEGRQPFLHISTVPSFDVAEILANFLMDGELGSDSNLVAEELLPKWYQIRDYQGISGNITIDPDGITRSFNHSVSILKGGKLAPE